MASILPWWKFFAVGDDAGFDQGHDAVADHFGVDAEVVFMGELHDHRVGDAAVADLQGGAVGDHVGDVLADSFLDRADLGQADFEDGVFAFDQGGDLRDVDVAVAAGEGNVGLISSTTARAFRRRPWCSRRPGPGEAVARPWARPCWNTTSAGMRLRLMRMGSSEK